MFVSLNVFGGDEHNCNKLSSFYKNHTKCVCNEHIITDGITASLIKYTINSFLALKVIFFNEMKFITFDKEDLRNMEVDSDEKYNYYWKYSKIGLNQFKFDFS